MRNRIVTTIFLFCLLANLPVAAAGRADWNNLKSLKPGDRVRIVQANRLRIDGRFQSSDDAGITVDTGAPMTVRKDDVLRVSRKGITRGKRILIGALIGAAAAGIIAAGIAHGSNNEGFFGGDWEGAAIGTTMAGGVAIGAGIGAVSGSGYKTVYQRQKP